MRTDLDLFSILSTFSQHDDSYYNRPKIGKKEANDMNRDVEGFVLQKFCRKNSYISQEAPSNYID